MFKRLHPLYEADGDIGASSEPDLGVETEENTAEPQPDKETNEPDKIEQSKSFAKRLEERTTAILAEKRAEWEAEQSEKYKDYDTHKEVAEYFREVNNFENVLTLKEQIEMEKLQARAEREDVSPEVLKRIDELEVKAAKGEQLEKQQEQQREWNEFETSLKTFCEGKEVDGTPVNHMDLWKFMSENQVSKPEIALKAMKSDALEQKLATAREDSIKDYLASKQAPRAEGNNGAAGTQRVDTSKMSWKEIEKHTVARLEAAKIPQ
jgi:hypothetical protein